MDVTLVAKGLDLAPERAPQDNGLLACTTAYVRKPGQAN